jgi:hypothetical protein
MYLQEVASLSLRGPTTVSQRLPYETRSISGQASLHHDAQTHYYRECFVTVSILSGLRMALSVAPVMEDGCGPTSTTGFLGFPATRTVDPYIQAIGCDLLDTLSKGLSRP